MFYYKKLRRLNAILGAELGRNPFGEPLYSWHFSNDLTHHMQKIERGRPVFDYHCECGVNRRIHRAGCVLSVAKPVYIPRPLCPTLRNQYVAVLWCDSGPLDKWLREFGTRLQYDPRGYLLPTNACLGPGEEPDETVTWELIDKIRKQRKKSLREWIQEAEDGMALGERRTDSRLDAAIGDACTAFGNAKPGSRMGGISFPAPATSATGQEAGRIIIP